MTRTSLLVLALLVPAVGAADEEKYTSKDGRYAVRFPAGAAVKTDKKKLNDIELNIATVKTGGATYIVSYKDLPAAAVADLPAKKLFDGAQVTGVSVTWAKLERSEDFEFGKNKYPAREVLADKDGVKLRTRLVLAGTRLYLVTVGGPNDSATSKEATAFLDSFEITK